MTAPRCHGHGVYNPTIKCSHGPSGKAKFANCALVWVSSEGEMQVGGVHHCRDCATAILSSEKEIEGIKGLIGYLPEKQVKEYCAAIKNSRAGNFIRDGITKVRLDPTMVGNLRMYVARHLSDTNPDSNLLANDKSGERDADDIPTRKETSGRRWCQLYPKDDTMAHSNIDDDSLIRTIADLVSETISREVLTTIRFSQIAHEFAQKECKTGPCTRRSVRLSDELLNLTNANVLYRGHSVELRRPRGRQSTHMDGRGYKPVVLIPLQYHEPGKYDLYAHLKSHRIDDWEIVSGKVIDEMPWASAHVTTADMNEAIVFSERLMHSGGTCSCTEGSEVSTPTFTDTVYKKNGRVNELYNGWFGDENDKNEVAGTQPTDMAIQFNFEFSLLPYCSSGGNGRDNIWTLNECWQDGTEKYRKIERDFKSRLAKLPDDLNLADDEFVTAMKEAQAKWLDCLLTGTQYEVERRGK